MTPLFREIQRMTQPLIVALVLAVSGLCWWMFISQVLLGRPIEEDPAPDLVVWLLWIVLGTGGLALLVYGRMETTVTTDAIEIRWRPFPRRVIPLAQIAAIDARRYRPLLEFGGWGIRGFARNRRMAYNAVGDEGVELTLTDGRRVMVGSQRMHALAAALREAAGGRLG